MSELQGQHPHIFLVFLHFYFAELVEMVQNVAFHFFFTGTTRSSHLWCPIFLMHLVAEQTSDVCEV